MRGSRRAALFLLLLGSSHGVALASPKSPTCSIPFDFASLDAQRRKLIVFGEIHGTRESPALVGQAVCNLLARTTGKVGVALEWPVTEQGALDRYLASKGRRKDEERLLATRLWRRNFQDGKTSEAMFDLLRQLRAYKQDFGPRLSVSAIDTERTEADREGGLTRELSAAYARIGDGHLIALVGNLHNRRTVGVEFDPTLVSMAARLTMPFYSFALGYRGGSYWVCTPECGVQATDEAGTDEPLQMAIGAAKEPAYDGLILNGRSTASLPKVRR